MSANNDSVKNTSLDAPLTLPADQLELVAGGLTLAKIGAIGPINGLWQVRINTLPQIALPSQVAF